eukprot:11204497-Lingulodinium_polyedra.AAC.1
MMRSNQPLATATTRKSHASHTPCEHQNWRAHGVRETCDLRVAAAANGRVDRIIVQRSQNATQ